MVTPNDARQLGDVGNGILCIIDDTDLAGFDAIVHLAELPGEMEVQENNYILMVLISVRLVEVRLLEILVQELSFALGIIGVQRTQKRIMMK